jgi:hypothetical protein
LFELRWGEIRENEDRREAEYAYHLQPAIKELLAQMNDRTREMKPRCTDLASPVQEVMD